MKIRQGFVSNSSSSSFVIGVTAGTPLEAEALHKEIFGTVEDLRFYGIYNDLTLSSYCLVLNIIKQIRDAEAGVENWQSEIGKMTPELLKEVVNAPDHVNIDDFRLPNSKEIDWPAFEKYMDAEYEKEVNRVLGLFKGMDIYAVSFSDNDGARDSEYEHGPILKRPNVIRYSKH